MKETISAFAKGKINTIDTEFACEPSYISVFIEPDSIMQGSFMMSFTGNHRVKGCIFSTNRRMVLEKDHFLAEKIEMSYTFNGIGMHEGDIIQGDFIVLCESGEYRIPYTITAQQNTIVTSQGRLRSLDAFAALASADREEAYRAFCKRRFLNTLKNEDVRFTTLYTALTRDDFSYEAMDEFLSAVKGVDIDMAEGNKSPYNARRRHNISNQEKAIEKDRIVCLYELFLDFRTMQTSTKAWLIKTRALLSEQMGMKNDSGFYSLYYVHTLIIEGKKEEAQEELEKISEQIPGLTGKSRLYAYYLYLSALINMSDAVIDINCKRIWDLYKKNNEDSFILWILFMMEKRFLEDVELKCKLAKDLYERGVSSPIILMEIALLFKRNPDLLTEFSDFNIQVLLFAARNNLLTPELYPMIFNYAIRSNRFDTKVYLLLVKCYEALESKDVLQTICHYLIRNNKSDNNFFKWFALGVEQDLRIARLYDYYLYSVKEDMQRPLPEKVLQYFKFNMEIEYNKKSFLFANLYRFREEIPEQYEEYKEDMDLFIRQQLQMGRINRHLAYLYSELLDESYINEDNARQITDLLFSYRAYDLPQWATGVIITDSMFVNEKETPIMNHESVVYMYSEDSCVLLRDGMRKRFIRNAGTWEKWFENPKLLAVCEKYCPSHPGILLRRCDKLIKGKDSDWLQTIEEVLQNREITFRGKENILQKLFNFFYEKEDSEALERMLEIREAYPEYLKTGVNHLSVFLMLGYFEEAYEYSLKYGCEHILPGKLVPMCDYIIACCEDSYDENLYKITKEVFLRGKYSERMLEYLVIHVRGDNAYLKQLLLACKQFSLDADIIEEKILIQALFCRQVPETTYEVYRDYDIHGGKTVVKNAFLSFIAHEVITKGRVIEDDFLESIDRRISGAYAVTDVCKILWLKAFANGMFDNISCAEEILDEFEQNDRFFDFYKNLPKKLQDKYFFSNKVIVQCISEKNADVNCYYSVSGGDNFVRKHMMEVYDGVFATVIPLFADEEMLYYITAEKDEYSAVVKNDKIKGSLLEGESSGRYDLINKMLTVDSYEEKDDMLLHFLREDLLNSKLFSKY